MTKKAKAKNELSEEKVVVPNPLKDKLMQLGALRVEMNILADNVNKGKAKYDEMAEFSAKLEAECDLLLKEG